mmetsp:Transcript_17499/g.22689  ORF Transcript_17499/g.22689 Transcript_17499/m.22689 type:complete len:402 (+) Transcript_17499:129-1334(+)
MQESTDATCPELKVHQVQNCNFTQWFHNQILKKHSIKSIIIEIEANVVEYLLADGVVLPKDYHVYGLGEGTLSDDEGSFKEDEESENNNGDQPEFPELLQQINSAIDALGGEVFPKLNWSAPKDAAWINCGSMKCKTAGDIFLLLKSSEFIIHDILHAFDKCVDKGMMVENEKQLSLVLRRWSNLLPSMQFRCFVRHNSLAGICQRDCSSYYSFLEEDAEQIFDKISSFFDRVIKGNFPDPSYVVDLYVDKKGRVWIIDFNVFGAPTDTLLFTWEYLMAWSSPHEEGTNENLKVQEESNGKEDSLRFRIAQADDDKKEEISLLPAHSTELDNMTKEDAQKDFGIKSCDFTVFSRNSCEMRVITSANRTLSDPFAEFKGPSDTLELVNGNIDFNSLISLCQK